MDSRPIDATDLRRHILDSFEGTTTMENAGDLFFIYDPDGDIPPERTFPYVTIVTGDNYDSVSRLDEPGAYRLNIGLTKATYTSLFGAPPTERDEHGVLSTGYDHAARDQVVPHPIYAGQYWVSVVNPTQSTMDTIRPMLAEAYEFAARKHNNKRAKRTG
ncbi:DUF6194 family protein [Allokutzneria albata]|uniref:DUF6194 domain-containing protein n=1 Tax=Allokutzneria albata TaxID=211114 RepID=A0A1G9TWM5_ALLAB|nr:DUF6194 family protein [Allokutzneria albata]SDM51665.1 hypothetical protein SAMN04489726_2017 [Allokutzneria albata]